MTQDNTQRQNIADIYPLSPLQQGMLFHTLLHEDSGVYIMQDRYRIHGRIDVDAFEQAWQTVVDTHPALRTGFSWKSQKQPLQIVYKKVATPLTLIDLRGQDSEEQDRYIEALLQREQRSGFNMAKPPLIRFRLVQRGEDDYELVRSFHHILMDAWCISLILVDFLKLYDALLKGEKAELTPPRPFRDYIAWLQRQDPEAARDFWQRQLDGLSSSTSIPLEREARRSQYGEAVLVDDTLVRFSESQTRQLHDFCRRHDLTPNTFFQGVWALLLSRYSGHEDVLFGVTVSGRPPSLSGVEKMVGLFINSQPLRVALPRNTTVIEWLNGIQNDNLAMREYEHTSLVDIQGWSDFPRGETLFDTLLVYENAPFDRLILDGEFSFQWNGMQHGVHTHYGLTVVVMPHDELELKISYDYARFDRATVDAMLVHMRELALAMVAAPDAYLDRLNLLERDERHQLLHTFNQSYQDFPLEHAYPALFERQAARHAQRTVASCQGQSLSFADLDQRSNRLGHAIASRVGNTREEFLVALLGERDLPLLAAMVATFKAGGAYLPLAPTLPDGRLQELFALSQASVLVASESCRSRAQALAAQRDCQLLIVEDHWLDGDEAALPAVSSPERLAYVLFTSGSTGTPKGVMVEQRGMLNNIFGKQPEANSLGLSEQDVIAQTASQAFDISVWQFLAAPVVGARVEILPDTIAQDPTALLNAVVDRGITLLEAVPAMIRGLLDEAGEQPSLGNLRWLIATGEALPPALANEWLERFPQVPIMNAYGPAECSDDVAFHALRETGLDMGRPLPVGKPTANNQLYILDEASRPLPVGVPGEICVSGVGVGRGYWQDPERTGQVFTDHPFSPGERFYRTGDLGRWLPDGTIEYLGRRDFQVKIRGHRIELGEIENRLEALPQVRAAAVVAPLDGRGERRLVGYWTATESSEPDDEAALTLALAAQLPEYMVPSLLVRLESLPLSPNGKIDRKALEAKDVSLATTEPVAPRNETEAKLAAIWANILQRDDVGVEDSFFALGGHSLLATRVMARIREAFQQELPLRTLFEQNTIAKLAALLDDSDAASAVALAGTLPALTKQPRPERLPLSHAQQRMWFLDQLEPGSAKYNTAFALRFSGPLDAREFADDLDALVARHPILRCRVRSEDDNDTPWLTFDERQGANLQVIQVTEQDWPLLSDTIMPEAVAHPFSLEDQPPIRTYLYQHAQRDEAIFLCVQHHAVTDGWSIHNLLTEWAELRLARRENRRPLLPALPIDYVDFSLWQRRPEQQALFDQQLAYWERTLGHDPYVLDLPTDRPRSQLQGEPDYHSGDIRVTLDRGLTDAIRRYAAQRGVTPFAVMMASLHLLLGRYCGQQQIRVGTPVAGRTQPETHPLVGCFVNTLVIQSELAPALSFDGLVAQLQDTIIEAQANQDVPFERVVETLSHSRDLSVSPLFQVLFTMHQHRLGKLEWGGNQVEEVGVKNRTSLFELCADVIDDEQDLALLLGYRRALFEDDTAHRWLDHWINLLAATMADPARELGQYPLLDKEEVRQLAAWNDTGNDFAGFDEFADGGLPLDSSYPELFARQVERQPDKVAAVCGTDSLSYRELDLRSNRLGHVLADAGAQPEQLVALLADRGLSLLTAMIATFKAGAAYLPLDPGLPATRLEQLLSLSNAPVLAVSNDYREQAETLVARVQANTGRAVALCIIEDHRLDGLDRIEGNEAPLALRTTPDSLAYVVFTSGSTGTPKGAMVEQRGMLNNMFGNRLSLGLSEHDRVAQTASQAFDISVWQFLAAPLMGATVHILPEDITRDPAALAQAVQAQGITLMELVPTQIRALLAAVDDTTRLDSLRWLQSIGEALPAVLVRDWLQRFPSVPLLNAYGPAECSDNIAWHPITAIPADLHRPIPVGRPTANNQLFILDSAGRQQPIGVAGEICVAGTSVGRGYWRDPERTAEVFGDHPFAPGERFYRTGDLGRMLADGTLEYLGRKDFQLKLRGQRIEPGEIEACLELLEPVDKAAVVAVEQEGTAYLVAYWQGRAVPEAVLRDAANAQLPAHMVPALFVHLEALPQNRNGKVDRKALMQRPVAFARNNSTAPRNETERQLVDIWKALLPVDEFGVEDNFFALGGHSLLATQVLTRIRQRLGVSLPMTALFNHNTVAGLANAVSQARQNAKNSAKDGAENPALDIRPVSRAIPLPLSYAQQRLWFLDQLEGSSSAYNIPVAIKLRGNLNRQALQAAMDKLLERHESLRTGFRMHGDMPRQHIVDGLKCEIAFHDLSSLDKAQQQSRAQQIIDEEADRPFDLSTPPMLRVALQRLAEDVHILQFTLHHIAADAWSLGVLIQEFAQCYEAFAGGAEPSLAALPIQYADYAHWQRSEPQQQRLARELDYWRQQLQGVPPVFDLPHDYPRPAQPDYQGAATSHTLPASQVQALQAYAQDHNATLFMVLLNAFNSLLQRATGKHDFIVGTDIANREHPDLEKLIGFFVNVLPLRARMKDDEDFDDRLARLRDTTLDAYQHQQVPFDKLVEMQQPPRLAGVSPLVQVLFVMQNAPRGADSGSLAGLALEELEPQGETSKFDLAVFLNESDNGDLNVRWLYRTSLFKADTVARFTQGFVSLLDFVAGQARQSLDLWPWQFSQTSQQPAFGQQPKGMRKKNKLQRLKGIKPTQVSQSPVEQVRTSFLDSGSRLPLVVKPRLGELDPVAWAEQSRDWIEEQLRRHGGLLFRGFRLPDASAFEQFAQAILPDLYGQYGDLPKNKSGRNIYHSTPYPEQHMILFHNESSHLAKWPRKQWFYCEIPASRGGCTPIVDCREVYRKLPPEILAPLEEKGLLYVRHFTDKLDVRWQDFFKTDDPQQVEARCREEGMRWQWLEDDGLRIEQRCPAVMAHPDTGEKSFFNQVQLHHESCLEPEVRHNLKALFGPDRLPRNVYYGDGTPIEDAVMATIGQVYEDCAVRFAWQQGDVVMLDNMLVAHARDPFEGERKICVAMGQMYQRQDAATATGHELTEQR